MNKKYNFKLHHFWSLILYFSVIDVIAIEYKLPFPEGDAYPITQCGSGYNQSNPFSHDEGSKMEYAWDFGMLQGEDISAIADGIVTHVKQDYGQGSCDKNLVNKANIVVIKHNNGLSSLYMHLLKDSVTVKSGESVKQGQIIGKSGASGFVCSNNGGDGAHLHFQLQESCGSYWCQSKNIAFSEINTCKKWSEPKSKNSLPLIKGALIKGEIFDGAGSLVSSNEKCWGCDKDMAVMHPHQGTGSTVVFQWLHNSNSCNHIDLIANKDIKVIVKSKAWYDAIIQQAFKVNLIAGQAISIDRRSGLWTTLAITSTKPIDESIYISAYCRGKNDKVYTGNKQIIDKNGVDVTHGYFWAGNGSIISNVKKRSSYGVKYDIANTFTEKKSLTAFQWFSSPECNTLEISDDSDSSKYHNNVSISVKIWDSRDFEDVCSNIPCDITKPSSFYIIKVKSEANEFNGGSIRAECK